MSLLHMRMYLMISKARREHWILETGGIDSWEPKYLSWVQNPCPLEEHTALLTTVLTLVPLSWFLKQTSSLSLELTDWID